MDSTAYSRDLKFTWLGNFWERRIEGALDFDLKDFGAHKDAFTIENISNTPKLEWDINFKGGVWLLRLFKVFLQV